MERHPLGPLNLNLLVALDALLSEESVTRAAGRLGVSQAAMSQSLSKLRVMLDDRLLVRARGGMVATPRARRLAPVLRRALHDIDRAVRDVAVFDLTTAERSFIIATEDMIELLLAPGLLDAIAHAPHVDLRMLPFDASRAAEQLECGDVDVVVHGRNVTGAGIEQERLYESHIRCIARPDHPAITDELDLETFVALPQALVSAPSPGSPVDRELDRRGLSRQIALRGDTFLSVLLVVATSDVIATVPHELALAARDLVPIRVYDCPVSVPPTAISMFWHQRFEDDPAHAWLRGHVRTALGGLGSAA